MVKIECDGVGVLRWGLLGCFFKNMEPNREPEGDLGGSDFGDLWGFGGGGGGGGSS